MIRFIAAMPIVVAALVASALLFWPSQASAHEEREVGNYIFEVGWRFEPTAVESPNSLFLKIVAKDSEEGMTGLEETLQAEVVVGGDAQTKELPLEPSGEEPGLYGSPIIPTQAGDYTFRIFGAIEDQEVDESFSSGPETFETVEDLAEIQFPEEVPSNAGLQASIEALQQGNGSADSNSSSDDTARILGIVGIIVGVLGLGAGGLALASRRS